MALSLPSAAIVVHSKLTAKAAVAPVSQSSKTSSGCFRAATTVFLLSKTPAASIGRRKEEMVAGMAPRCAARHNFA
jgi:hypothetical protein